MATQTTVGQGLQSTIGSMGSLGPIGLRPDDDLTVWVCTAYPEVRLGAVRVA